ncbi:extracellular solute-binding protein [Microbacterium sp. cf332]|uniref:extracellular solute-binding protein n=1 Tax=Microbacterium sp. cf332 TaxID=1761804 RepID=UPI00088E0841|nr:extracellular solute-binding protein [Microbacterium sp. cf332]SDQ19698.1 arabinogalactan oligomer / maltooligosaccharide transport system substrate-binding protein [Microbacterium sp. cf332]
MTIRNTASIARTAAGTVALLGVGLVAGCSTAPDVAQSSLAWDAEAGAYEIEPEIAGGEAPLKVWVEYPAYGEALVDAFTAQHPGIRVELTTVSKVDAVAKMKLDGEAGTGADVYFTNFTDLPAAIDSGVAAPLGQYDTEITERVGETFAGVVSREGELYGVPVSTESIALFYNKTLLQQLTGSSEPAQTWEQIRELAAGYNDPRANRWAVRWLSGELYYAYPVLTSLGWHLTGDAADPGLNDAALTTALEYYGALRDLWQVNSADATWDSIEMEFAKGETPYVITGPWSIGDFTAAGEAAGFEFGVTTLPAVDGGDEPATLAGLGVGVVSGYSAYPGAARVFAAFLASDAAAAALYDTTGGIPALTSENAEAVPGLADDEHAAGILAQAERSDLIADVGDKLWTVGNTLVASVWDRVLDAPTAQRQAVSGYADLTGLGE